MARTGAGQTPARLGFRMPGEWEPHLATWIAWPHERSDWPRKFETIRWVYGEVVRLLSRVERVRIFIRSRDEASGVRRLLGRCGAATEAVEFRVCPTDRSWTRDYLPLFLTNRSGDVRAVSFRFNAWAKYDNWRRDAAAGARIAASFDPWKPGFVLEGGAIDVNGAGTLLTTEECLLSDVQARNPGLPRAQMETMLRDSLGVRKILWLGRGIAGDDTHGHVDDVARFVSRNTVVAAVEDDPKEVNHEPLRDNLRRLRRAKLRVVKLPMPRPLEFDGQRLPASYANFYVANRLVLVPTFNDPADRVALNIFGRLFPARDVVGIHAVDLVLGLGTLHCMTMQQPAPALAGRRTHDESVREGKK